MAKTLKAAKRKPTPKRAAKGEAGIVLVGTYKAGQLDWIGRHGLYNYPVKEDDGFDAAAMGAVGELWLYADAKGTRHCYAAEYVGKVTREEWLKENPSYPRKKVKVGGQGQEEHAAYYVFKAKKQEYGALRDGQFVVARADDFAKGRGKSQKIKQALERYRTDGEFAPLAAYLPTELSQVPKNQLRVCEPWVQMEFVPSCVPFPTPQHAIFKFIDLFAGIGGFRMAMQRNGGECVFSSEWNPAAQKTYFANYGDMPYGDITLEENKRKIPNGFDVLCAGFPCQPFSIAGVSKKNSLGRATGFEDKTQGTLFFDVCTIIKRKRPKAFLLENVKNLCSHDKGNTFRVIREALEELDYSIFFQVIDGQNFVPQHRERILIVGFDRKRYGREVTFDFKICPVRPKPVMRDILERNPDPKYTLSDKLWGYLQQYAEKHKAAGNGFGFGIAPQDGVSRTLSARYYKDGSEILIEQADRNPRRLTPLECARLMGYPSNFKIVVSDCQAYRQFGNSVVMPLMADVGRLIVNKLSELEQRREAQHE